jgi:hypothetical protein
MAKLPKYTLTKNDEKKRWDLVNDQTDKTVRTFKTKADATKDGALQSVVGSEGGSVKIQKESGRYQEERTYPRSRDPKQSPG